MPHVDRPGQRQRKGAVASRPACIGDEGRQQHREEGISPFGGVYSRSFDEEVFFQGISDVTPPASPCIRSPRRRNADSKAKYSSSSANIEFLGGGGGSGGRGMRGKGDMINVAFSDNRDPRGALERRRSPATRANASVANSGYSLAAEAASGGDVTAGRNAENQNFKDGGYAGIHARGGGARETAACDRGRYKNTGDLGGGVGVGSGGYNDGAAIEAREGGIPAREWREDR